MSKFCNQCGTELVDGKCPKCSDKKEEIEEEVVDEPTINMEDVKNKVKDFKNSPIVQKVISYYKSAILSPIKAAKEEGVTTKFNWLICLLNSVIIGLMTILFFKINLDKLIKSVQGFEKSLVGFSSTSSSDLNLPYFKIMLFIAVMSIISNIIIVVLEKIFFGLICRNKDKMGKYFSRQMVLYTIFTVAFIASIIASFVSLKLYAIVAILGLVMAIVVLVQLLMGEKSTKKNVLAIVTPIYVVISIIAVVLVFVIGLSTLMYSYNASSATISSPNSFIDSSSGYDSFNW